MGYISVSEAARQWEMSERSIQGYCKSGKIEGAKKVKDGWLIPSDAKKPQDGRIISGKYVGWRKKYPKKEEPKKCTPGDRSVTGIQKHLACGY